MSTAVRNIALRFVTASGHRKSVALMKFLSTTADSLGVGKHVYVVGGAVRNWVIGQPIKDVDIVIDSVSLRGKDSEWFAKRLKDTIPAVSDLTTNQYGVAILTVKSDWYLDGENLKGEVIEIANARKESYGGPGGKGYKPSEVAPATIQDDIKRREFTFNTLLWRLSDLAKGPDKAEIIDITGCGLDDLREGLMRCPSDPDQTFSDDPTRMIRAVKFLIKYGFKVDGEVKKAIQRNARKIKNVPQNAIAKLLIESVLTEPSGVRAVVAMRDLGLLDPLKDMVENDQTFRVTLRNWAKEKPLQYLYEILDAGFPLAEPLPFLSREQKRRFRDLAFILDPDQSRALIDALSQPGKAWGNKRFFPSLIKETGISKRDIRDLASVAEDVTRDALLENPALLGRPRVLRDLVRSELV